MPRRQICFISSEWRFRLLSARYEEVENDGAAKTINMITSVTALGNMHIAIGTNWAS